MGTEGGDGVDLSIEYVGIKLSNPLIIAPGPLTGDYRNIESCISYGAGAIVVKSAVSDSLSRMRKWPRPRYRLLSKSRSNFTLYSFEQAFRGSIDDYMELLKRLKGDFSVPIFASFLAADDAEWLDLCRRAEDAGVDGIELDISCPHTMTQRDSYGVIFREFERVTALLHGKLSVPVIPKLFPLNSNPAMAKALKSSGASGIVVCNRLTGLDINIFTKRPILHGSYAGFGGPWSKYMVMKYISDIAREVDIPISASGGVVGWDDIVKYVMLGASSVQICSALILSEPQIIGDMIAGLRSFLAESGQPSISGLRGKALENILSPELVERDQDVWAEVIAERCNRCLRCIPVCKYNAISVGDRSVSINRQRCDGCGLCSEVCPVEAIALRGTG